jgi:hypothetical protein
LAACACATLRLEVSVVIVFADIEGVDSRTVGRIVGARGRLRGPHQVLNRLRQQVHAQRHPEAACEPVIVVGQGIGLVAAEGALVRRIGDHGAMPELVAAIAIEGELSSNR